MSEDFSPLLRRELLDDFHTECDELLGQIRLHLGALEQPTGAATSDPATLENLYRHVHSLKGNCGIVELRLAEQLAHAAEDVLRSLSRGETRVTPAALDLLVRTTQRLEQIVTAHRLEQPLPEIGDLIEQLGVFRPPGHSSTPGAKAGTSEWTSESTTSIAPPGYSAKEPTGPIWRATFSPSADLDRRGVNVTGIRQRLAMLGAITNATPTVREDGTIAFEFTLAPREPPDDLASWEADGVVLRRSELNVPLPAADAASESSRLSIAPSHLVRVDLGRLDDLMRIMGEMVIHRSHLGDCITRIAGDSSNLQEVNLALARSLRDLRAAITRVRLVPVAEIFTRMPYVVRDLSREIGRKVRLVLEGHETEIDKFIVERLKEPILHLVRNAISHGIEAPEARAAAGKSDEGTIVLRASTTGQAVVIEVRDDGCGIDPQTIIARGAALGLPVPEEATDADILNLLCLPGFSTRDNADIAAGRGVGMAVVQSTVRELGGMLSLESVAGESTRFTLRLPLTLSIADTFIVSAGAQTCALSQGFIEEIVEFEEEQVRTVKHVEIIPYRDGVLPLVRLARILNVQPVIRRRIPALVVSSERGLAALAVDRVHAQREVVVRPLSDPLLQVPGISGATELGDGRPVLILDPAALTSGAVRPRNGESPKRQTPNAKELSR